MELRKIGILLVAIIFSIAGISYAGPQITYSRQKLQRSTNAGTGSSASQTSSSTVTSSPVTASNASAPSSGGKINYQREKLKSAPKTGETNSVSQPATPAATSQATGSPATNASVKSRPASTKKYRAQ